MEVEVEDRPDTWVGDAESAEARGMVGTARAVLAYALKVFPSTEPLEKSCRFGEGARHEV
jgi:pre-mRNA-processing factor 6